MKHHINDIANAVCVARRDTTAVYVIEYDIPPPPRHFCLCYCRSEEMKRRRRIVGDHGGIKFQGKTPTIREDLCINTLTSCLKDNLILELL